MKKKLLSKQLKRKGWTIALFLFSCYSFIVAQTSNGAQAIIAATTEVKTFYTPFKGLVWVAASVIGIAGCFRVYNKFQSGDPDASKGAMLCIGGAIALWAGELLLRTMFSES